MFYIMNIFKKIYIYNKVENMPEEGWFQACFNCGTITSRLYIYDKICKDEKIFEINVYLCPPCCKKREGDSEFKSNFVLKCVKYINKYFFKFP